MKSILLFVAVLAACILWPSDLSLAQCPEDPNDNGICDTLYVEFCPPDALFSGPGHLVQVPIRVTNDILNPAIDSIAGFVIPLCYTHSNPSKYCSLSGYWNNTNLYPDPNLDRSIFRHLDGETNWMTTLSEHSSIYPWDTIILMLDGTSHFWLSLVPTGMQDQRFWGGSRVLVATMTFRVEDTMTVCLDTCFWPISGPFNFVRSDAVTYVPRDNMPYCFSISSPAVGDVNADGVIDIGDVVYLINYLYRDGDPPDPVEAGDCNCDQMVDLGDVVYLVNYLYKGGPAPGLPVGILVNYEGCKEFQKGTAIESTPPDQDCIEYQYDGVSVLLLKHVNAGFNCCPDEILADITIEDNVITIEENESLESGGCDCLCLFDVDYQINNLPPGEYTIRINGLYLEEGNEILQFTVDLASSPSGSFCIYRDHYPWGIW